MTDTLARMFVRADWQLSAACRGMDANWWFPPRGGSTHVAEAKAVCATCPVAAACLQYAITNDERTGIWGGRSIDVYRRSMPDVIAKTASRRGRYERKLKPIEHGNYYRGYAAEKRRGIDPCAECKQAAVEWRRQRKELRAA